MQRPVLLTGRRLVLSVAAIPWRSIVDNATPAFGTISEIQIVTFCERQSLKNNPKDFDTGRLARGVRSKSDERRLLRSGSLLHVDKCLGR